MRPIQRPSPGSRARVNGARWAWALGAVILLTTTGASAQEASPTEPIPAPTEEAQVETPKFELTFGNSKLFFTDKKGDTSLPVSSALFLFEYFLTPTWHLITCMNLPLSNVRTFQGDGTVKEEYAPASILLGVGATLAAWDFRKTSRVEIQIGALAGRVLSSDGRYFPLSVARVHILKDQGFGLYVGTAFAFRVDTLALIYGAGHRF